MSLVRFDTPEGEYVSLESLLDWLRENPIIVKNRVGEVTRKRVVPLCIWGAKGIGKTSQIKAYCEQRGLELRTYHPAHDQSGADIVGIPYRDEQTNRTGYGLPHWLPTDADPPGLLFMDEINRANELVMQGLMEPLGEGTVSQSNWQLPDHWQVVAAANPGEAGYDVRIMDDAMVDRLLHYAPGWDAPGWAKWATTIGLAREVVDFALARKDLVAIGETQLPLEVQDRLEATPRSLEYLGALLRPDITEGMLRVVAHGLLGRDSAPQFIADFKRSEKPLRFDDLVAGNAGGQVQAWVHTQNHDMLAASTSYMISGLVGRDVDPQIASELGKYLALLPDPLRQEAWIEIDRSAPAWLQALQGAARHWHTFLAEQRTRGQTR